MKLTWLTDIHLNFLEKNKREEFYQKIISVEPDAVLITGDIAEAPSIEDMMKEMVSYLHKPIYFVLGNHDYYFGEVAEVREAMITLTQTNNKLYWLPASGVQQLTNEIILLGQDGWADGRLGDYENSRVSLNDSRLINDLFQKKLLGRMQLLKKMQELADVDAAKLHDDLIKAVQLNPKKILYSRMFRRFEKPVCIWVKLVTRIIYLFLVQKPQVMF